MNRRMFGAYAVGGTMAVAHGAFAQPGPASSGQDFVIDATTIARFSPRARADLVAEILDQWKMATDAGIMTALRAHHFFAQIATETGGLQTIIENMNYSEQRLLQVFPSRVTAEQARKLAHKPVEIANHVYGGILGNRETNDGWDYRGSGLIQLTGRYNFARRGKELGLPFEEKPEMVRTPSAAFQAAVAYWQARGVNAIADRGELGAVRFAVNGGTNGLEEAGIWFARAQKHLRLGGARAAPDDAEELAAAERALRRLGYLEAPTGRSTPGDASDALRKFQQARGLEPTGRLDEDTLYEIVDPNNFRTDGR